MEIMLGGFGVSFKWHQTVLGPNLNEYYAAFRATFKWPLVLWQSWLFLPVLNSNLKNIDKSIPISHAFITLPQMDLLYMQHRLPRYNHWPWLCILTKFFLVLSIYIFPNLSLFSLDILSMLHKDHFLHELIGSTVCILGHDKFLNFKNLTKNI